LKPRGGGVTLLANLFSSEKVYATTGTFYPDADPETTTVDGNADRYIASGGTFSNIRDGAGTGAASATSGALQMGFIEAYTTTDTFDNIQRGIFLFNTSSIGSGKNIDSAYISVYITTIWTGLGHSNGHIVSSNPASNTDLVSSDYGNLGSTSFGYLNTANMTLDAYNNITLNSSGLANISLTGVSKFGGRIGFDLDNIAPTWINGQLTGYRGQTAETGNGNKLVVTYTVPANPKQDVIWFD